MSSANTSWFGFHANVPDGLGFSVRQQPRLKVLTAEAVCLKTWVLLFCVIEGVCDTQTPPARHSLQVKSNNGNYLLYLSEKDRLQLSTKGTSRFPGDGTGMTVCRLATALNFHECSRFEVVSVGCFDLTLDPLMSQASVIGKAPPTHRNPGPIQKTPALWFWPQPPRDARFRVAVATC